MNKESISERVIESISLEFFGARLGDDRRRDRLCAISEALAANPDLSLPEALGGEATLEGAYRFFSNPSVSWEHVLKPHIDQTICRLIDTKEAIVIHDTTEFCFPGEAEREGLGRLRGKKTKGFFCHLSFALDRSDTPIPLGVVNLAPFRRLGKKKRNQTSKQRREDKSKESIRWLNSIEEVESKVSGKKKLIHVTDREGDFYELIAGLVQKNRGFVIRLAHDRRLLDEEKGTLFELMNNASWICEREVTLSARKDGWAPQMKRRHPGRKSRVTTLSFSSTQVTLRRPVSALEELPSVLTVNVVRVRELSPPEGCEPVEWRLITSEPIIREEETLRVVDIYRSRWIIEEYFKAIKTGCRYEEKQLESYHSLMNALAVFLPIAWKLLLLRSLERSAPEEPANRILNDDQLPILRAISKKTIPENPTVKDIFQAIAGLGGHIKNNGVPGWQVLWRGYQKFLTFETGWNAAMRKYDQS